MDKRSELHQLTQDLHDKIRSADSEKNASPYIKEWQKPDMVKKAVLGRLSELLELKDDPVLLAKFQVGLPKFLDYYYFGSLSEYDNSKINQLVTQIVLCAYKMLTFPPITVMRSYCGVNHEDKACIKGQLGPRSPVLDCVQKNWVDLPAKDAAQFQSTPNPIILPPGTRIHRILNANINNHTGSWWFYDYHPYSKKDWRSSFAVSKRWNMDNDYITFTVGSDGLRVWAGEAASQQTSKTCVLLGGKNQVWVAPNSFEDLNIIFHAKQIKWPFIC